MVLVEIGELIQVKNYQADLRETSRAGVYFRRLKVGLVLVVSRHELDEIVRLAGLLRHDGSFCPVRVYGRFVFFVLFFLGGRLPVLEASCRFVVRRIASEAKSENANDRSLVGGCFFYGARS